MIPTRNIVVVRGFRTTSRHACGLTCRGTRGIACRAALDRAKAAAARAIVGARSTSEVIDVALDQLIRLGRLRADVAAYTRQPATEAEAALALLADAAGLADDIDWEALYADESP